MYDHYKQVSRYSSESFSEQQRLSIPLAVWTRAEVAIVSVGGNSLRMEPGFVQLGCTINMKRSRLLLTV